MQMDLKKLNQLWIATFKMYLEAIEKGYDVNVSDILRDSKSILNELNLNKELLKEEWLMVKVLDLINEAQQKIFMIVNDEFSKKWNEIFKRILKGEEIFEEKIFKQKFYTGIPRDRKWFSTNDENIAKKAMNYGLCVEKRGNVYIIVGEESSIKDFLRRCRK